MSHGTKSQDSHEHNGHHDHRKIYYFIAAALLTLTAVTVWSAQHDFSDIFSSANIVLAMVIATTKASLVALFFMHLHGDSKLNNIAFFSSILFLVIFLVFTAADVFTRAPDAIKPFKAPIISQ